MVNGVDEPVFLDTKILVYANVAESPVHDAALAAIEPGTKWELSYGFAGRSCVNS
jgi:hypothetical protein